MTKFIFRTTLLLGLLFSFSAGKAQTTDVQNGKEDCGAVKSCCAKKDAKEIAPAVSYAAQKKAVADCPLRGTPDCPLVNDCPLKGTPDCPLVKKEDSAGFTAKKATSKKKAAATELPACCRKSS